MKHPNDHHILLTRLTKFELPVVAIMKLDRLQPNLSVIVVALLACLVAGCQSESISDIEDLQMLSVLSRGDDLTRTMQYVQSLERYDAAEFRNKVNSGMNRWINNLEDKTPLDGWQESNLIATLPPALQDTAVIRSLPSVSFTGNDASFIQQAFWLRELAARIDRDSQIWSFQYPFQQALKQLNEDQRIALAEKDDLLTETVKILHDDLSDADAGAAGEDGAAEQLASAMKYFEWVVRNVQPIETPPWLEGDELVSAALVNDATADSWPPAVGAPGPGYQRFPWQALTYGKGDMLDRAEIFVMLCQQRGLPAYILAFGSAGEDSSNQRQYREWLPAVLIDGKLFLFDTQLGIPIPGEKPGTVATLSQVVANPQLLRNLDLSIDESVDASNYRVEQAEIENGLFDRLVALVAAPPESLSKRMRAMESSLTGDSRLQLTVDSGQLAQAVKSHPHVTDARLWHVPYSTHEYREQLAQGMITAQFDADVFDKVSWVATEESYVDNFVAFRGAKNLYLRGIFETDRTVAQNNCIYQFFNFMYSDEDIAIIEKDVMLQASLGIYRPANQSFNDWNRSLLIMKGQMHLIRADAAFFLALCHYENGYPSTAIKWLEQLPIYDDQGRWTVYSDYHSARAYEAIHQFETAAAFYADDQSPGRHGSLIRKRWAESLASIGDTSRP